MPHFVCLLLPGVLLALRAAAQQPESPDSTALKGRIWVKTAEFVWRATAPAIKLPANLKWKSTQDAAKWLKQHDSENKSGMRDLPGQVLTVLPKPDGVAQATPSLLVSAIVRLVHDDKKSGLESVKSAQLGAELRQLLHTPSLTTTPIIPPPALPPASTDPVATTSPVSGTAEPIYTETSPQAVKPIVVGSDSGRNWRLTALIALATAAGGAIIGWLLGKSGSQREVSELKNELDERQKKLAAFEQEQRDMFKKNNSRTTAQPLASPMPIAATVENAPMVSQQAPEAAAEAAPTVGPQSILNAPVAEAATLTVPQVFFAALRENAFVEDSQLRTDSGPNYPLKITVDARNPKSARFEYNTSADPVALIEYRLEMLRQYFHFTLPTGRPSELKNRRPGTLTREADGWRVNPAQKGELLIS